MRAVVQRVSQASVVVDGRTCGSVRQGLLVYLGVERDDGEADVAYLAEKIHRLRIFPDQAGRLNLDVEQVNGGVLVVSAFTVGADARKGHRPSFDSTAPADRALGLYDALCRTLAKSGLTVQRGSFGNHMDVQSINSGPVCILLDSKRRL